MDVFITAMASFLPNDPVDNEAMEARLGMINQVPSRTRRVILRNNRIERRHYAIDPATGDQTHSNAELTAEAVRRLQPPCGTKLAELASLCCGTSTPDQIMPGHGLMVHGELKSGPTEVLTTAGICVAGMTALKHAWMQVALGLAANAVATGSELVSNFLRAPVCGGIDPEKAARMEAEPYLSFEADFLRWMLSDGAGAAWLSPQQPTGRLSYRIDWIDQLSFAHELETCMYAGATKTEDGRLVGWRQQGDLLSAVQNGAFPVKQDTKLLNAEIIPTSTDRVLRRIVDKRGLRPEDYQWFVPHYSSDYFRDRLHEGMRRIGFDIPQDKWFSNLAQRGNTGAASIYIMLDELLRSGRLTPGERLLCFIPESGRFSVCYMQLTVV